ncbi:MAG: hypothetical protein KAT34_13250, partial [Candidatus Aminicenantes bacterium]|nr:hypothetical protein [Candidatus Aminicenantes bacterium]
EEGQLNYYPKMPDITGPYGSQHYSNVITREGNKFIVRTSGYKTRELQEGLRNGNVTVEIYINTWKTVKNTGPFGGNNHIWKGRVLRRNRSRFFYIDCTVIYYPSEGRIEAFGQWGRFSIGYKNSRHLIR